MARVSASIDIAPDAAGLRVARVELAAALRAAALYGFNEGIDNHFSLVVPGRDDCFLLNPYGPHWSEMRASDLLTIGLGGERLAGEGELDMTAFTIHLGAHRARPDAACVLHTHMPYATALAMTEGGFDTRASQNAMYFHGRIARLDVRRPRRGRGGGRAHRDGPRRRRHGDPHGQPRRARRGRFGRRRVAPALLPRAGLPGAGAGAVDRLAAAARARGGRRAHGAQFRRVGGQPELFAAVRRELDRVNPGYER